MKIYPDMIQGSDEWYAARCGLLTASEMRHIITPSKLQYASNDKERGHLYELVAQRIGKYVEPTYIGDDMLRGQADEIYAREIYNKRYAPLQSVGFIANDKWDFTLGYSPDALTVCGEGQIECKSRRQKYQIETIISGEIPSEYLIQLQTGLLVSERKWCDFVSYSGGLPMFVKRVLPDENTQKAIIDAATIFHEKMHDMIGKYQTWILEQGENLVETERRIEEAMI